MDGKKLSIKEILEESVMVLNNISVPVFFTESIGIKLAHVAKNLNECVVAINNAEQRKDDNDTQDSDNIEKERK